MLDTLITQLNQLESEAQGAFDREGTEESLYQAKVGILGKKGRLTDILKDIGNLSAEDRPKIGKLANELKSKIEEAYSRRLNDIKSSSIKKALESESIDVSLPGVPWPRGHLHPITQVLLEMKGIFRRMAFDIREGLEIETDYFNFEALNIPADHPARDMQDTFYIKTENINIKEERLLRTHTSPVQIHVMKEGKLPIRMVAPGVVYRRDSDVSHSPMFHQIEGLVVDCGIHLGHLKGVLEVFLQKIFHRKLKVRFRPSFFPFTEPSAEVDIECVICGGSGCRVCKNTNWIEVMGCGMVDPEVFRKVKINSEKYTGFAFGIGIERIAMLKYGINDIRLFYENDKRFLDQF